MLRVGTPEEIAGMIDRLENEAKLVLQAIIQLVYFMRGAVQYHDMLMMTPDERNLIKEFIAKRLDDEKDMMHPNY